MALCIEIHAPTLTDPLLVYETGNSDSRLYAGGIGSISRQTDLYTGTDAVASAGIVKTSVDNRDGLLSPDGCFAPDWREVFLTAQIDDRPIFVGRAVNIREGVAGVRVDIHWRDLVDDFLAQQIEGIPGQIDGANILASTDLTAALEKFGILDVEVADIDLWVPQSTTTLRKWLIPVLGMAGYTLDWTGAVGGGAIDAQLLAQYEGRFGNDPDLPTFTDEHLVGDVRWDSGREQVLNIWKGARRFWNSATLMFDMDEFTAYGDTRPESLAALSRSLYGDRSADLDLSSVRADRATLLSLINRMINRRAWAHPRGTMKLAGPDAAALRIGDGFFSAFNFGVRAGRGLHRVWRVVGRTLDMVTETTVVRAEIRDGRDADYQVLFGLVPPAPPPAPPPVPDPPLNPPPDPPMGLFDQFGIDLSVERGVPAAFIRFADWDIEIPNTALTGTARSFVRAIDLGNNGSVYLSLWNAHFTAAVRATIRITITAGGNSVTVTGIPDPTSPYHWVPSNRAAVEALLEGYGGTVFSVRVQA